ncbi:hypothetical protein EMIHUDRAFT_245442 [Emiliania huxleyi CCMP1516]|uniref:Uncharacterized protein n=2 Tax=Emiliania huxleyi TaxID=2903 RepID=A0A0D3IXC5_EMIH1|nr:hypothetical protein EMIHUDRAFT_245442 [Emiliania huxleyi CCMP1516]EOD15910.1 hypothetical protein EMIHUDRAFT_245442 [Emiliania huxleyi CCMP1516]|eukprot:XP_005768339.1 hypothetical protein EMIHUDRAFT_245442 [Emiliania huxleyi CCMP1516]
MFLLASSLLATWTELSANGSWPTPRHGHSAVFCPRRGWMLLFGGNAFDPTNQLFRFDVARSEWAQLKLAGPPSKREGHTATLTADGRMVVFGGYSGKFLSDAPCGRDGHSSVLAPDGATLLIHGGFDGTRGEEGSRQLSDTYALDTTSWGWRRVATSPAVGGSGEEAPPARCMHCAAWVGGEGGEDGCGGMLLFGGYAIDEETDEDRTLSDPALRLLALLLLLAGALLRRGDYARLGLSLLLLLEQQRVSETLSRLRGGGTALPSRLPRASPPRAASLRGLPWRRKFG